VSSLYLSYRKILSVRIKVKITALALKKGTIFTEHLNVWWFSLVYFVFIFILWDMKKNLKDLLKLGFSAQRTATLYYQPIAMLS